MDEVNGNAARPRSVIYAAKSTADPNGSIPTQLTDCRALAEQEGLKVVAEYSDEAASGYSANRGSDLARAIEHAERIAPCALIVQHSDRLKRGDGKTAKHTVEYALWALKHDVKIRSVQDDQTFGDLLYAVVTGQRNNEDSKRRGAATRAGLRRVFEKGGRIGGPTPDGFECLRELRHDGEVEKSYVLDPERASIIQLAFELYESGMGDPSVARELNRRGHRTKTRRLWERRRVGRTLQNHFYAGRIVQYGEGHKTEWRPLAEQRVTEGHHVALIEPECFDRCLKLRAQRDDAAGSNRSPRGRPHSNHALGNGLAVHAECGSPMRPRTSTYKSQRKDGSRRRTYVCIACDARIDAEVADAAVIANLDKYLGDFDAWQSAIAADHTESSGGWRKKSSEPNRTARSPPNA